MTSMDELETTIGSTTSRAETPSGAKTQVGEGRGGVILGVAILVAIGVMIAAILLIPDLLAWIISIGIWFLLLLVILAVIFGILAFLIMLGVSIFYLAKRNPPQGPEASYSMDMVKEPPKKNI